MKPFIAFCLDNCGKVLIPLAAIVAIMGLIHHAKAEKLSFNPKLGHTFKAEFVKSAPKEWPYNRLAEICDMAVQKGFSLSECPMLEAHLLTECGTLDAYCSWKPYQARSDHGFAIGMAQWFLPARYADWMKLKGFTRRSDVVKVRDAFYQDFPEMRDWKFQIGKYLDEIAGCRTKANSLKSCIAHWNPGDKGYLGRIETKAISLAFR